jgi:predicted outer membrane repeat protein
VIYLADGVFRGDGNRDLDFHGKAVTVRSLSGDPSLCIIDCNGDSLSHHRGFHFHSGEGELSVVEGLTISGGHADHGGGILCDSASSPTIRDCILFDNRADTGAGMFCWPECNPTLLRVSFEYNNCEGSGGGIKCFHECAPTLIDCVFRGNNAEFGGGLYCSGQGNPTLKGCHFDDNYARFGGGVYCQVSMPAFAECVFTSNRARWCGAGAYVNSWAFPTFDFCTFVDNEATCGASISSDRGSIAVIRNCTMVANRATRGAGVECDFAGYATVLHTLIAFNTEGSAVCCRDDESAIELRNCDLYGNAGGDWIGCVEDQLGVFRNFCENPLFCDFEGGDYHLSRDSPCAPGNLITSWLVGAWPVACD